MMDGWNEVALGEITEMIKRGIPPKYVEDDGHIVINQKCIRDGVLSLTDARLTSTSKKFAEEKFIHIGDVLINSTGTGTLGRTATVKKLFGKTTVDTHVTIVRANNSVDRLFLGYLLSYHEPLITSLGKGATNQIELGASELRITKVKIPKSKKTQRKIASILSAYDDLIENNLKRIKLLEEQAQQTYEEWFVRFKFPGYENVEFDDVSGLPVGWEKVKLNRVLKASNGKSFKDEYIDYNSFPVYGSNGIIGQSNSFNNEEAIIVGRVGAYCGATRYCKGKFWATDNTITLTSIDLRMPNLLAYYIISLFDLRNMAGGSAQPLLTQRLINNLDLIAPAEEVSVKFNVLVKRIFDNVLNLQTQNQLLKEARDILLPRLMGGVIDVDSVEVNEELGMVAEENDKYEKK